MPVILRFAGSFIMNEWYNSQKKLSSNFRKLLLERLDKVNPSRKLVNTALTKRHSTNQIDCTYSCITINSPFI